MTEYRRKSRNCHRIMLIGGDDRWTSYVSSWISGHPGAGLKLEKVLSKTDLENNPFKTLTALFVKTKIDCIIVMSSQKMEKHIPMIVSVADNMGIRVKILAPYLRQGAGQINCDTLAGIPIVSVRKEPLELLHNRILKRILDITVSGIACVMIDLWLVPLIGAIIRLNSKGPVIFRQERIGREGAHFVIYKFRTMRHYQGSRKEAFAGISHITEKDDDRFTSIGKWLRKTNIDEFPQLFNVLIGSMSLVGPRPHMVSEDLKLKKRLQKYPVRRYVKPGITGWAQINGYRGGTKDMTLMQNRTEHDIWYIENWSIWLDIKIIAITFWKMVTDRTEAY